MIKILIAEDDTLQISLYKKWLPDILSGMSGILVSLMSDGKEIDDILTAEPYDITLLDIALPKKSGLELYKAHHKNMGSVIVASSYGDVFNSYLNEGTKCVILNKPFDKCKFESILTSLLEEKGNVNYRTTGKGEKLTAIE